MDYKDLVHRLRSVESRSKSDLLEESAKAIETLETDFKRAIENLRWLDTDCLCCGHTQKATPCEDSDFLCGECEFECPCKDCKDNSNWTWRR